MNLIKSAKSRKIAAANNLVSTPLKHEVEQTEKFMGADEAATECRNILRQVHYFRIQLLHSQDPIAYVRPWAILVNILENHVSYSLSIINQSVGVVSSLVNKVLRACHNNPTLKYEKPTRQLIEMELCVCTDSMKCFFQSTSILWKHMILLSPFVDVFRFRLLVRNYIVALIIPLQDLLHRVLRKIEPVIASWKIKGLQHNQTTHWDMQPFNWDVGWDIKKEDNKWENEEPTVTGMKTVFGYGDDMLVPGRSSGHQFPWVWDSSCLIPDDLTKDTKKLRYFFDKVFDGHEESQKPDSDPRNAIERQSDEAKLKTEKSDDGMNPYLIDCGRPIQTNLLKDLSELAIDEDRVNIENNNQDEKENRNQGGLLESSFWDILYYTREPSVLDQMSSVVGSNIFRQGGRNCGDVAESTWFLDNFILYYRCSALERLLRHSGCQPSLLLQSKVNDYQKILSTVVTENPIENFRFRLLDHESRRKGERGNILLELDQTLERLTMSDFRPVRCLTIESDTKSKIKANDSWGLEIAKRLAEEWNPTTIEKMTKAELRKEYIKQQCWNEYITGKRQNEPPDSRTKLEQEYRRYALQRAIFKTQLKNEGYESESEWLIETEIQRRLKQHKKKITVEIENEQTEQKREFEKEWKEKEEKEENKKKEEKGETSSNDYTSDDEISSGFTSSSFSVEYSDTSTSEDEEEPKKKRITKMNKRTDFIAEKEPELMQEEINGEMNTKCRGVHRNRMGENWYWVTSWRENGEDRKVVFSEVRLGFEVARAKAIALRREKEILGIAKRPRKNKYLEHRHGRWGASFRSNGRRKDVYFSEKLFGIEKSKALAMICCKWIVEHPEEKTKDTKELKELTIRRYDEDNKD